MWANIVRPAFTVSHAADSQMASIIPTQRMTRLRRARRCGNVIFESFVQHLALSSFNGNVAHEVFLKSSLQRQMLRFFQRWCKNRLRSVEWSVCCSIYVTSCWSRCRAPAENPAWKNYHPNTAHETSWMFWTKRVRWLSQNLVKVEIICFCKNRIFSESLHSVASKAHWILLRYHRLLRDPCWVLETTLCFIEF